MDLVGIALRNARRSPLRAALTVLAVGVSLVAVVMLRAVNAGYTERVTQTPDNRVVSRHKIGWQQTLPIHYADEVRKLPGIKTAMGGRFANLKHPAPDKKWFHTTAVEPRPFVEMHYELGLTGEQKRAFVDNRTSALVSLELSEEFGWKLGDTFHLEGTEFPGSFELSVAGIFQSTRHGFAERSVWMHFDYYNEKLPLAERDQVSLISAQIHDPRQGARLAKSVDIHFDERDHQTFTMEDQAMHAAFVGMFGAILEAIDLLSLMILGVVVLILGNTLALGVRERTQEYGVLRAIGFTPRHLFAFVVGEASALGLVGGALGLLLSYPLVEGPVSRYMEESMDFAPLSVPFGAAFAALVLGGVLGALAATIPAYKVARLEVTESLRHVG